MSGGVGCGASEHHQVVALERSRTLSLQNYALALELAGLPDVVRGYEDVKLANVATYRIRLDTLRRQFRRKAAPGAEMTPETER